MIIEVYMADTDKPIFAYDGETVPRKGETVCARSTATPAVSGSYEVVDVAHSVEESIGCRVALRNTGARLHVVPLNE